MHTSLRRVAGFLCAFLTLTLAPTQAASAGKLTITPAEGGATVAIEVDGGKIRITSGTDLLLTGTTKDGQKRRYANKSGAAVAEVKLGETDGFKVRTPASKLLWKIRTADTKTKISDNEENKDAFELALKGSTVRVTKGERLLGAFAFGPSVEGGASTATKVKDPNGRVLFTVDPATRSSGAGALLLTAIPTEQRYIIVAEMFARTL